MLKQNMFSKLTVSVFSCSLIFLSACGGGSDDSVNSSDGIPESVISAPDKVLEGTTEIAINGLDSQDDGDGSVTGYVWAIEDDGGIAELKIADSAAVSTQITNIPNSLEEDITIVISLVVVDDENNESSKVTKSIKLVNKATLVRNSESFNGTWKSPCFNTNNKTSVEQTVTILDKSMTGVMEVYSAGSTPAFNCVLPASSTGLIVAHTVVSLDFDGRTSVSECTGGKAETASVNISSIKVGRETYTSASDIAGTLALLAPTANLLPASTNICVLTNGNLLYGGEEYTRSG